MTDKFQLTPVEYELMEILWKIGSGSVWDVMDHLPKKRDLAYTSVSTILRILQQKKILRASKNGRQHCYEPLIDKNHYAKYSVQKMVSNVFAGKSSALIAQLIKHEKFTTEDLSEIEALLDQKKRELSQ